MPLQTTDAPDRATAHNEPSGPVGENNKAKSNNSKRVWLASCAVFSLLALFLVDGSARKFLKPDNYAQPNTSWAWWMTKSFRENGRADVAILGSSLMVATVVDSDATFLHQVLDQVTHHRSFVLEDLLKQNNGATLRTQSFAIGGQMASDAYAITTVLLSGSNKPNYIVWGIAPRDFVDATFTNVNASETVHYMTKVADGKDVLGTKTSLVNRLDHSLATMLYLYHERDQIVALQHQITVSFLKACGWNQPDQSHIPEPLHDWAAKNLAENEPPHKWNVEPYAKGAPFTDNSSEYQARYNPFKPSIYKTQLSFYEKMLHYCKENGIRVLIFNMPITSGNQKLLPGDTYLKYRHDTDRIATTYGAEYVDLNRPGLFQPEDFRDTVHMNGKGGLKFWDQVARSWR